ncbi:MAG: hypothetical protein ACPGLV_10060 [Bacteroidia bacterium]
MEENFEDKWLSVESYLKDRFSKALDIKSILFILGLRELGKNETNFTKEEKMDLMNVGFCKIASKAGYFDMAEKDQDGWPIFKQIKPLPKMNTKEQEQFIKEHVVNYFETENLI